MRAIIQKKQSSKLKWIIPLVIFICAIVFEKFLGDTLFFHSYKSILSIQNFLNQKMGLSIFDNHYNSSEEKQSNLTLINSDSDKKDIQKDINNFVKTVDGKIFFSEFIHFLNTNNYYLLACAIAYNFVNLYKVYVLANTVFLANFISSTLCFILHYPRPYMEYFSIKPVIMFNEWGTPNTQIIVLIAFYLSLFEVVIRNKKMEHNLLGKIIIIVVLALFILFDIFLLIASGNVGYNQLIISIFIGLITYQIIFYIFNVEVNNAKQFYNFLKFENKYYIFINIILLLFQFILYIFVIDKYDEMYYTYNINEQQHRLFYSKFLSEHFNYRTINYLNKGIFSNVICFAMNIVAFLGVKLELYTTYKNNYSIWSSTNFEKPRTEQIAEVVNQEDFIIKESTQWNHTRNLQTIIRLILVIIFSLSCLIPSIIIYSIIEGNSDIRGYVFIVFIPLFLTTFGIFYLFKVIFKCFKLTRDR